MEGFLAILITTVKILKLEMCYDKNLLVSNDKHSGNMITS